MEGKQAPPVVCSHRVRWESIASVSDGFLFASVALFPCGCFDKWKFAAEIWRPARQSIHVCITTYVHVCEYILVNIKTERIGYWGKHWLTERTQAVENHCFSFDETNWSYWIKLIWSFFQWFERSSFMFSNMKNVWDVSVYQEKTVSIPIHCNAFVQNWLDYTKLYWFIWW